MNRKLLSFSVIAVALLAIGVIGVSAQISGGSSSGWAWSSNIGWLSASSSQSGAGGGGPYSLADNNGSLTGYMWSSNIGWVQFGGLSGCPTNGNSTCNATIDPNTGAVNGWARAVAGVGRTDGWDGWIELSGYNHASPNASGNGGVTYITSGSNAYQLVGYAWGGPVIGWLQFNLPGGSGVTVCQNCNSQSNGFSVTGSSVALDQGNNYSSPAQVTISRTGNYTSDQVITPSITSKPAWLNVTPNFTPCTLSSNSYSCPESMTVSSAVSNPTQSQSGSITVTGRRSDGVTEDGYVGVTLTAPQQNTSNISLYIGTSGSNAATRVSPLTTINVKQGNPFGLAWAMPSNINSTDYYCTATDSDDTIVVVATGGSSWPSHRTEINAGGSGNTGNDLSVDPNATVGPYTFTINCSVNSGSSASYVSPASVTLNVISSSIREQ